MSNSQSFSRNDSVPANKVRLFPPHHADLQQNRQTLNELNHFHRPPASASSSQLHSNPPTVSQSSCPLPSHQSNCPPPPNIHSSINAKHCMISHPHSSHLHTNNIQQNHHPPHWLPQNHPQHHPPMHPPPPHPHAQYPPSNMPSHYHIAPPPPSEYYSMPSHFMPQYTPATMSTSP